MFKNMKLMSRIALVVGALIITILGVVTLLIGLQLSRAINELVLAENLQISQARGEQIGELMDKLRGQLVFMSQQPQLLSTDNKVVEATVKALAADAAAEGGALIFAYPDGAYITSTGASGSIADREYFDRIVRKGEDFVIADAAISKSLGVPIIVVAKALIRPDGSRGGLIAFQTKTDTLSQYVAKVKIGKTGYAYIVDRASLIIAHPNPDIILNLNLLDSAKSGWKGLDLVGKAMAEKESGWGEYGKPDGSRVVAYFSAIPNSPGWDLGLAVPVKEINATRDSMLMLLVIIACVTIPIAIAISIMIARSIANPLKLAADGVVLVSEGKLSLRGLDQRKLAKVLERGDEVGLMGRSVRTLVERFSTVATEVTEASNQVSQGSQQLAMTSQILSQGANDQAASIEELSASVEELVSTIRQNADNTSQADALSRRVALNAEESGKSVNQTVSSMKEIASRISIIEEIARQTNLLALNAAIEAARAGDAGKGFAVVASEVRKLAERSQKAAGEINELSSASVAVAGQAGKLLTELVPDIRRTAELIQEIAAASVEQASGADQIAKGVNQIDGTVQQNASTSEELASTAEELASQAEFLNASLSYFQLDSTAPSKLAQAGANRAPKLEAPKPKSAPKKPSSPKPSSPKPNSTKVTDSAVGTGPRNGAKATQASATERKTSIIPAGREPSDGDFEEF
ncbi:MAG: methyl-accepting chemotaxis protein [Spirochaetaceae bacterium]|nr:methyl-accepting chemotaxis protein [Spirochaetaceae bacterium]